LSISLQMNVSSSFQRTLSLRIAGQDWLGMDPPPQIQTNMPETQSPRETLSASKHVSHSSTISALSTATNQVQEEETEPSPENALHIFYNIYIPFNQGDESIQRGVAIVHEQMNQVVSAIQAWNQSRATTVYYNTVGAPVFNSTDMDRLCSSTSDDDMQLQCQHMEHYEHAQEEQTLQRLHNFCLVNPEETVAYMHTKGSFHETAWNGLPQDTWRRHATMAVTSQECVQAVQTDKCNVCGLLFTLWPFLHAPGNFWTADCSYVGQLLPPDTFADHMEELHEMRLQSMQDGRLGMELFDDGNNTIGRGRYAAEHWIGSHPDLRPCDLSVTWDIKYWQRLNRPAENFQFGVSPRHPATLRNQRVRTHKEIRFREYFLLAGSLFKWLTLYNTAPPEHSWIWDWFPDGQVWKDAYEKYGDQVVEVVTEPYVPVADEAVLVVTRDTAAEQSNQAWSIFYNIYIPSDKGSRRVRQAMQIVEEQLDQIALSYVASKEDRPVTVYYNTIGKELVHIAIDRICSSKANVRCEHMDHFLEGHEDVTLDKVYDYCQTHESSRVVYIHSKGAFHPKGSDQEYWRQSMMDAVTSESCLQPPNDTCSVCGLLLLPFPALHMPGNFWTAKCSYIQKLIPPRKYGDRMVNVTMDMLLRRLQGRFVDGLLPEAPWHYGIDRWSSEHWVGSHPSVVPCDLSKNPQLEHWKDTKRNSSEFEWSLGPRHNYSAPWSYVGPIMHLLEDESNRRREVYLLAGNLFKWQQLYNETPSSSSWVYDWYPEGAAWKEAIATYGAGAVDVMTEPYMPKQ